MSYAVSEYDMPSEYAKLIVNGICRTGAVVSRKGIATTSGTDEASLGNVEPLGWSHLYSNGSVSHVIGVTIGADVYKLVPSTASIYSGSGSVTESNAVMFDGVLQYTLYPAAAPRTWDGYSDAALSFTRPATGDWSDPVEKVTNGDFASGASWTTGAGWAIAAGTANATASSAGLTQSITFSPGRSYTVVFTLSGFAAGTVTPRFTGGTTVTGTARSANGTYTETITAHSGGNTTLEFLGAGFTGSIDNVSVKIQGNLVDADVTGFCVHKSRVWYWSRKSDEACYTALQARGGTLSRFPLHYVAETGGNIVLIESLTMDGGNGPDDFIAFILDTGECLIYQGSDPANAADWSIVGRFRVPPPLNGKCVTRIGGDSLMLTAAGLIPLQNYIKAAFGQTQVEWVDSINPQIKLLRVSDGRLYYSVNLGILFASVKYDPDLINTQYAGILYAMDVATGGWTVWRHSTDTFDVSTGALPSTTLDQFISGIVDASGTTYFLQTNEADGESQLLTYGSDSMPFVGVQWGFKHIGERAKVDHLFPAIKTSGTGEFGVSLSFDIVTTKYPQVEESFSGQIGLSDRAAYGECVLVSPTVLIGCTTTSPDEGAIAVYGCDLEVSAAPSP